MAIISAHENPVALHTFSSNTRTRARSFITRAGVDALLHPRLDSHAQRSFLELGIGRHFLRRRRICLGSRDPVRSRGSPSSASSTPSFPGSRFNYCRSYLLRVGNSFSSAVVCRVSYALMFSIPRFHMHWPQRAFLKPYHWPKIRTACSSKLIKASSSSKLIKASSSKQPKYLDIVLSTSSTLASSHLIFNSTQSHIRSPYSSSSPPVSPPRPKPSNPLPPSS